MSTRLFNNFLGLTILVNLIIAFGITQLIIVNYVFQIIFFLFLLISAFKFGINKTTLFLIFWITVLLLFYGFGYAFGLKLSLYILILNYTYRNGFPFSINFFFLLYVFTIIVFALDRFNIISTYGFFYSRNSFPGFIFALNTFFIVSDKYKKISFLLLIFTVLISGTLGALLSLIVGIIYFLIKNKNIKIHKLIPFIVLSIFLILFLDFEIIERTKSMYYTLKPVFINSNIADLKDIKYGDVVAESGSSDLSLLFRIKHWLDIVFFISKDYIVFFGYGLDSVKFELPLNMAKYPHNDYLRILVEAGLVFFIVLISRLYKYFDNIDNIELKSLILMFSIISFSENMLNNFLTSSFIFISLGFYNYLQKNKINLK